ncbi:centromeric protein e (cenp-e protein) [Trichosporon asahii var. asahii CBS 8904]|uniref:Centromeric protein e (Cenp-e protein) n=1 Tax=Trichosporon asahii var. asahii (strain CBS 8904) TaxID=1220162 RepID=K1VM14_TRIAC|nr:centromeric protein e (cenp-e protein) [Trichosporon asahii var. asahii CBS 8904]
MRWEKDAVLGSADHVSGPSFRQGRAAGWVTVAAFPCKPNDKNPLLATNVAESDQAPRRTLDIGQFEEPHSLPVQMPSTPRRVSLKRQRDGEVQDAEEEVKPRVKGAAKVEGPSTPKRKVVNAIEGTTPRTMKKREPLNARLANAAGSPSSTPPRKPVAIPAPVTSARKSVAPRASMVNQDKVVVCMRIKPTNSRFSTRAYEITDNALILSDAHPNIVRRGGKAAGRDAEYTYTFGERPATDKVAPMVEKAMAGFNSTVFAGKSYTMSGTPSELGIIPCAVDGIFDAITADTERAFLLRVSYIEIYNESLRDLLNNRRGPFNGDDAVQPQILYVDPLEEGIVSTPQDVVDLLERGNQNRKTGATDWNERSSRSHAVFMITIESRPRIGDGEEDIRVSRLSLIDLAGSEKAVSDAERRGEGKHINQSLFALREVVHKLTEKGKRGHIPYRNSKLTHLLENVLGGDSNICVICTMSADEAHCAETLETLKFAGRCSQVETKARKNISSEGAVIRAKDMEIASLKRQLENLGQQRMVEKDSSTSSTELSELAESVAELEARKAKLAQQISKLNGEILTSELPRSSTGLPASPPKKKRPRISDFTSTSQAANLGIGLGTPSKHMDRRAVSTMIRVPEERFQEFQDEPSPKDVQHSVMIEKLDPERNFDHDVTIASLRRTIATKEEAISKHANSLAELQPLAEKLPEVESELEKTKASLNRMEAEHAKQLKEAMDQLDELQKTRTELTESVAEKSKQVEALETSVADLKKSHSDLSAAHAAQLAKLSAELEAVKGERDAKATELEKLVAGHEKQLADAKADVDSHRSQVEKHVERITALEQAETKLKEILDKAQKDHEASLAQHSAAKESADKIAAELAELKAENEKKEADHAAQLGAASEAHEKVSSELLNAKEMLGSTFEQLATTKGEYDQLKKELDEAADSHKKTSTELGEIKAAHEKLTAELEEAKKTATADLEAANASLAKVKEELASKTAQHEGSTKELAEKTAQFDKASEEIAALRDGASVAESIKAELEEHKSLLEKEKAERAKLSEEHAVVVTRAETLTSDLAASKKAHETEAEAHVETKAELEKQRERLAELEKELATARAEVAAEKTKFAEQTATLEAQRKSAEEAEAQVKSLKDAASSNADEMSSKLAEVSSKLDASTKAAEEAAAALKSSQDEHAAATAALEAEKKARDTADKELVEVKAQHMSAAGDLVANLTALKKELEEARGQLSSKTEELDGVATQLTAAKAALSKIEKEGAAQLRALQGELDAAKGDVNAQRSRADKLAQQLLEKACTSPSKVAASSSRSLRRVSSVPSGLSASALGALRGTGDMSTPDVEGWKRSHATEELQRLDKVVVQQKAIIEEQRDKIRLWTDELQKQRDVVRLLSETSASSLPPIPGTPSKDSFEEPTTPSKYGQLSTPRKSQLPSTFTARNLALPSTPSLNAPSPLPMHTGQVSNALRKARRVTLERDMGRLQERAKVANMKNMFDSPSAAGGHGDDENNSPHTPVKTPSTKRRSSRR